jgi:hypothetical protein
VFLAAAVPSAGVLQQPWARKAATRELVRDQAWEFMFVLGVSRLRGAVQTIINPTAIR